jgi:hypothetical protein
MCQSRIEAKLSKNTSCPGINGFSPCSERSHRPFERSNTFDCLRTETTATPTQLRKAQSAVDVTRTKVSIIPLAARPLAFLWRKPAQKQAVQENPVELAEDIKQRWRRQQIAIQQKLSAPEKTSFWGILTRNRSCLSNTRRDQLRS